MDKRDECMKYAQRCGVFDAMTIGAVSPQQVDENLALMAKYPTAGFIGAGGDPAFSGEAPGTTPLGYNKKKLPWMGAFVFLSN